MIELLSSTAYLIVNKELSRKVGLQAAALLADLISKQVYFEKEQGVTDFFFNTEENITKDTTLSPYQQRACITKLKTLELITVKLKGIPAKRYFKVNAGQVMNLLNNKEYSNKITINKNKEIIINNNITNIDKLLNLKNIFIEEANKSNNEALEKSELLAFTEYWTEPNPSKTKLKYQLQRTWSYELRIKNWARNIKTWAAPKNTSSKIDIQLNEYNKGKEYL